MSIKHSLLALLGGGPAHGYQLRQEFEDRTGGTWPLNIGQVYSTLQRLQRDGLVEPVDEAHSDPDGRVSYRLTDLGHAEVATWFATPVEAGSDPRDELSIKFALAVGRPDVDVVALVQGQRHAGMQRLQQLTKLKRATSDDDLAWSLVLERLLFLAEAQLRWLDHVEGRLARAKATAPAPTPDSHDSTLTDRSTR